MVLNPPNLQVNWV